eukprot:TRINITY_DN788_c0_g1_i3.p1 TRINITY_DN788_c0_g1~~TRINITY_DN788_c0_g1_i3.p1  ORF type:complete len:397 (-),score=31.55 TRINITY_DN788_c0_g1_i3:1670-2746(-)
MVDYLEDKPEEPPLEPYGITGTISENDKDLQDSSVNKSPTYPGIAPKVESQDKYNEQISEPPSSQFHKDIPEQNPVNAEYVSFLKKQLENTKGSPEAMEKVAMELFHALSLATPEQVKTVATQGVVDIISSLLEAKSPNTLLATLNSIRRILELDKELAEDLDKANCITKIENCQVHESDQVYQAALSILEQFFDIEDRRGASRMLEGRIRESIRQYEQLKKVLKAQDRDTTTVTNLISMFKKHLESPKTDPSVVLNKKHLNGLKEIFYFYCRQQYHLGKTPTFEVINHELNIMTLGTFVKFCIDFAIPLKTERVRAIFKKHSKFGRDLTWDSFLVTFFFQLKLTFIGRAANFSRRMQ